MGKHVFHRRVHFLTNGFNDLLLNVPNFNFFQQKLEDNGSLFTSEGLQPSIDDLDNIFDNSSDETEGVSLFSFFSCKFWSLY